MLEGKKQTHRHLHLQIQIDEMWDIYTRQHNAHVLCRPRAAEISTPAPVSDYIYGVNTGL